MAASQGSLLTPPPPPSPAPRDCASEDLASSQSDSSEEEFTLVTPRKRRTTSDAVKRISKKVNAKKSPSPSTSTANRYAPLQNNSARADVQSETEDEDDQPRTTPRQQRSPPPIILCGKPTKHIELVNYLAKHATIGFNIKYTLNNTNIYIKDIRERAVIVADMALKKMPFYTYTATNDKTYGFVLRGLDYSPEPAELAGELRLLGVDVRQTFKMRTTARPLYLVIIGSKKTLAEMNKDIQFLFHTRVQWERHQNKKQITQCHRCQKWGHATTNCYLPPVCLKCAGPHISSECKKPRDTPAKCANCSEAHPANSITCTVYARKLEDRAARQQKLRRQQAPTAARAQAFVDAPLPARNAWTARANAAQAVQPPTHSAARSPAHPITAQAACPAPAAVAAPQPMPTPYHTNDDTSDLQTLFREMNKLSSIVNIKNMIRALKDLNAALTSAKDEVEKFMTFVNFSQDLKKYNI